MFTLEVSRETAWRRVVHEDGTAGPWVESSRVAHLIIPQGHPDAGVYVIFPPSTSAKDIQPNVVFKLDEGGAFFTTIREAP